MQTYTSAHVLWLPELHALTLPTSTNNGKSGQLYYANVSSCNLHFCAHVLTFHPMGHLNHSFRPVHHGAA